MCTRLVANNGLGLDADRTDRVLARLERSVTRLPDSDGIYSEWRRLVALHAVAGKKTHDARLVAALNVHGITDILTFNTEDLARCDGITVVHPKTLAPNSNKDSVTNTGRLTRDPAKRGIGLTNSLERLRLMFGDRVTLELRPLGSDEVTCDVIVPLPTRQPARDVSRPSSARA